jgi:hypothetical protein
LSWLFFFLGGTNIWIQGLTLAGQTLWLLLWTTPPVLFL